MAKKSTQEKPFGSRLDHLSPLIKQVGTHKPLEDSTNSDEAAPAFVGGGESGSFRHAEPLVETTREIKNAPLPTAAIHVVEASQASPATSSTNPQPLPISSPPASASTAASNGGPSESPQPAQSYQPAPPEPHQFHTQPTAAQSSERVREKMVRLLFNIPENDYQELQDLIQELNREIGPGIDMAHVGRGLITRFITSRRELLEAARGRTRIKRPNTRNPREVAEVDNTMAEIQATAFRRAKVPGPR